MRNYVVLLVSRKKVPIYLPENKYIEQLGYETVRKSPTPPWQSSIRPLSEEAYQYILANAGGLISIQTTSVDTLKDELKQFIRSFYLENNTDAILKIKEISTQIADAVKNADNLDK